MERESRHALTGSGRRAGRRAPLGLLLRALLLAALGGLAQPTLPAAAAGLTVTTTTDELDAGTCGTITPASLPGADGQTSLREAICAANNAGGSSTIDVPAGTYTLTLGELQVATLAGENITVNGAGSGSTIIRQQTANARVFNLDPNLRGNTVTLSNLEITGGVGGQFGGGGVIAGGNAADQVFLSNDLITGNATLSNDHGGGISFGGGTLSISGSTISDNTATNAHGGGVYVNTGNKVGNVSIAKSSITNNSATGGATVGSGEGGGIYILIPAGSTTTISESTLTGNSAQNSGSGSGQGGAVFASAGAITLRFDRVVGNTAPGGGTGVFNNTATVTATDNFWGCNAGPGNSGCDSVGGTVTTDPRLVLGLAAVPSSVNPAQSSTLTADLTHDSSGADTSTAGHLPDGTPVGFSGTLGTVNPANTSTSGGKAGSTYTAGSSGGNGSASATVDNQTVTVPIGVNQPPLVTTQPADQTACSGASVSFTAAAGGSPTPTVQWQVSTDGGATFGNITGATSPTYTFTAQASDSGHQFRAVFTNSAGTATSNAATLTVNTAPAVTTQPSSQTVSAGNSVTFTAAAGGSPAPTVQWQVSTDGGTAFGNIPGATSSSYSFTAQTTDNGHQFRAVFSNSCGSATSNAATLTVTSVTTSTTTSTSSTSATATSTSTSTTSTSATSTSSTTSSSATTSTTTSTASSSTSSTSSGTSTSASSTTSSATTSSSTSTTSTGTATSSSTSTSSTSTTSSTTTSTSSTTASTSTRSSTSTSTTSTSSTSSTATSSTTSTASATSSTTSSASSSSASSTTASSSSSSSSASASSSSTSTSGGTGGGSGGGSGAQTGWISGHIYCAGTQDEVPGASVRLDNTPLAAGPLPTGGYQFAGLTTTGGADGGPVYTVVVEPPAGYAVVGPDRQTVTVSAGQGAVADFAVQPAAAAGAGPGTCRFVLGFAALHDRLPAIVGACLDDEQHNPATGDGVQHTTGGLLVWTKADNVAAFTDGYRTWLQGPYGLQERLNTQRFPWEPNPGGLPLAGALREET